MVLRACLREPARKEVMTMAQTTCTITLTVDGNHAVSVSGEDPTELGDALAWARGIYLKLDALAQTQHADEPPAGDPPVCEVHGLPMDWQKGRKGSFWSCHQKMPDGSWCSYKPTEG